MSTRIFTSIPLHSPNSWSEINASQESGIFSIEPEDLDKFPLLDLRSKATYDWEERKFVGPFEMTAYEKSRSRSASPITYSRSQASPNSSVKINGQTNNERLGIPLAVNVFDENGKNLRETQDFSPGLTSKTTFGSVSPRIDRNLFNSPTTQSHENIYHSIHIKHPTRNEKLKEEYFRETVTRVTNGQISSDNFERLKYPLHRTKSETQLLPLRTSSPKSVSFSDEIPSSRIGSSTNSIRTAAVNEIFRLYQTRDCLGNIVNEP